MEKYKKLAFGGLCVVISIILGYIFFKYIFELLLPFIVSFLFVAMARPLINKISRKTKIKKPIVSIFVISMIALVASFILGIILSITFQQITDITTKILDGLNGENDYLSSVFDFAQIVEEKLPLLGKLISDNEEIYDIVKETALDFFKSFSVKMTESVARVISLLPSIAVTTIVLLLSIFYFAKDYDEIGNKIYNSLPPRVGKIVLIFKNDVLLVVTKYIKAYIFLLLITFAQLYIGFLIVRFDNAFILALLVALVDTLPILGAATVLVPWGIIVLISGNYFLGITLLVLALITYLTRQFAEPKILSKQMNVHPLITLLAMYIGIKTAGFLGLIVAPIVAFIIKITIERLNYQKNVEKVEKL